MPFVDSLGDPGICFSVNRIQVNSCKNLDEKPLKKGQKLCKIKSEFHRK